MALALPLIFHLLSAPSAAPPGYGIALTMIACGVLALIGSTLIVKRVLLATLVDLDQILAKPASGDGDLSADAVVHEASSMAGVSRN